MKKLIISIIIILLIIIGVIIILGVLGNLGFNNRSIGFLSEEVIIGTR
ncbi:hypothetical protein [Fonticella tunisiensis]|uniref:Uncharacterized protein n=1 Tax=Fonticella tunisiensis TaxID=1096341 RepID=A0A4R7KTP5_9CLOT|nr:hypothetical protein [Fonticella tunisiensis]TDT62813.1 hypothetical protein EDD71_10386 [Fonticella tunisiensis]